jgi:Tol biopolymer transport system component
MMGRAGVTALFAALALAAALAAAPAFGGVNGRLAYAPASGGQVFSIPAKGGAPFQVTHDASGAAHPDWSRDGRYLAYDVGGLRLAVANADGSGERLVNVDVSAIDPSWSPDSSKLAFTGVVYDQNAGVEDSSLYVTAADGSGYMRIGPGSEPDWSPRADWIVYRSNPASTDGCAGIWRMHSDGSGNAPVAPATRSGTACSGGGVDPSFSPDGKRIVYVSTDGHSIYTVNLHGRSRHLVLRDSSPNASPVFSPDGRRIAYSVAGSGIWAVGVRGGRAHRLGRGTGYIAWQPLRRG